jgi:hypothetical protein
MVDSVKQYNTHHLRYFVLWWAVDFTRWIACNFIFKSQHFCFTVIIRTGYILTYKVCISITETFPNSYVGFEVFTVVVMKSIIWDMMPCNLLSCHLLACWFVLKLFLRSWRWRRYVPPKRWLQLNRLHGVISQKMIHFLTPVHSMLWNILLDWREVQMSHDEHFWLTKIWRFPTLKLSSDGKCCHKNNVIYCYYVTFTGAGQCFYHVLGLCMGMRHFCFKGDKLSIQTYSARILECGLSYPIQGWGHRVVGILWEENWT